MDKVGGGGLVVFGILLVILGLLIRSAILEWLLDIVGIVILIGGAIVVVVGVVKIFSGGGSSDDF